MTYDIGYILDNIPHTIIQCIKYNISYIIYDMLFSIYNF